MSDDAESIRERMQHVRRNVGDDVEGIVRTAKALSNWRYYVKNHPWACVGVALAAGFLIVPKRKLPAGDEVKQLLELLKQNNLNLKSVGLDSGKGIAKTLLGLATPVLLRGVMSYAGHRFTGDHAPASHAPAEPVENEV